MRSFINYLLKFLYPQRCVVCDDIIKLSFQDKFLCDCCKANMPYITENKCANCGRETDGINNLCPHCFTTNFVFDCGFAAFSYDVVRSSIQIYKYNGFTDYGHKLGNIMCEYAKNNNQHIMNEVDIIMPVPLSAAKLKERGFNQADILAEEISQNFGIAFDKSTLLRVKNTLPQFSLTPIQREHNIKDAFTVTNPDIIENKSILLIDDIFTTGSTINECARVLKMNGADKVYFFTLSIT